MKYVPWLNCTENDRHNIRQGLFKKIEILDKRLQYLLQWLFFMFKSLNIVRHEAWFVCMTCDWSTWLHHLWVLRSHLWELWNLMVSFTFILACSSPINSSYNECHGSDERHSTPSWHGAENALLQHKAEKTLDTPCIWTHFQDFEWHPSNNLLSIIIISDFLHWKQMRDFFTVIGRFP